MGGEGLRKETKIYVDSKEILYALFVRYISYKVYEIQKGLLNKYQLAKLVQGKSKLLRSCNEDFSQKLYQYKGYIFQGFPISINICLINCKENAFKKVLLKLNIINLA